MSSIGTSDGGYSGQYMKKLSEVEDELRQEHARNQRRNREQVDDLEKSYEKSLRKLEERSNDTANDIRESANESALRSRESDRNELDRIKQGYDRNGRHVVDADEHKQQVDTLKANIEQQREERNQRLTDVERTYEKRLDDQSKQYSDRMEKAVQSARDSASASYNEISEKRKNEANETRDELKKKYEELNRQRVDDLRHAHKFTEKAVDDVHRDYDNRQFHSDLATEQRLSKTKVANAKVMEESAKQMHDSHLLETRELRDRMDDLVHSESLYKKDRAEASAKAVRDYENYWRSREKLQQDSHEQELINVKKGSLLAEHQTARKQEQNLHARDAHFTRLLQDQVIESRDSQKAIEAEFSRVEKQLNERNRKEKDLSDRTREQQLHRAHQDRQEALEEQAKSYQTAMRTQGDLDKDRIKTLEKELTIKKTTDDTTQISPAAEAAVRRSVTKEYEKNFASETDRNRRAQEALQRSYSERIQTTNARNDMLTAKRENQNQMERHLEKAVLVDALQDTEFQKDAALRHKDTEHDRQTEELTRSFARSNLQQRNEYESLLQSTKDDAATRITAIRQEAEFASKSAQRAFANRQNALIREYEKKLADQKMENDLRMEDQRNQSQATLKESERRSKQAIDELTRGYEHRIAQAQAQQKERERLIAQNYEDELEKVKRTNALLQQKKS